MASEENFLRLDPYNFDSKFMQDLHWEELTINDIKDIFQKGLITLDEYQYGLDYLSQ